MTMKPKHESTEDDDTDAPETNDQGEKENVEPGPDDTSYFVGQQIDVLDSANRWTEAEVVISSLYFSSNFGKRLSKLIQVFAAFLLHTYLGLQSGMNGLILLHIELLRFTLIPTTRRIP